MRFLKRFYHLMLCSGFLVAVGAAQADEQTDQLTFMVPFSVSNVAEEVTSIYIMCYVGEHSGRSSMNYPVDSQGRASGEARVRVTPRQGTRMEPMPITYRCNIFADLPGRNYCWVGRLNDGMGNRNRACESRSSISYHVMGDL